MQMRMILTDQDGKRTYNPWVAIDPEVFGRVQFWISAGFNVLLQFRDSDNPNP